MIKRVLFVILVLVIILLPMLGISGDVVYAGPKECKANGTGWGCERGGGPRPVACQQSPSKPNC